MSGAQTGSVVWAKTIRGESLSRRCSQKRGTEPRTCTNDETMPSWNCVEKIMKLLDEEISKGRDKR